MKNVCVIFKSGSDAEKLTKTLKDLGINFAKVEVVGDSFAEGMVNLLKQANEGLMQAYDQVRAMQINNREV